MRYSQLFGKTSKTVPADALMVNHKLLVKGGFIRRISTGRWAFLPLGFRVWQKIFKIIDEEMEAIGCQRLVTPTLHPIEIWQATNRDQAFGEEMLLVNDHHGATFAIGATAEGVMLELVKMFRPSYKDLPIEVYQFSQKFRDDKRPRGGLLRVREFMMKDAYSFCANEKQIDKSYQMYYDAYQKIAKRLDLKTIPVLADSGAIGGSLSHEFMVESRTGENTYFVCGKCGYAANIEKCEFERTPINPKEKVKPFKIIKQPEWVCTMEDNLKHYGEPLWRYLKNVVYRDEKGRIVVASLRGDQDVNEIKLMRVLRVEKLEPATEKDLKKIGTKPGYVHSWGVKGVTFVGDLGLPMVKNYIGGQKEKTTDSINVNYGRDFKYKKLADIVNAKEEDLCAKCKKGKLREKKGIEWGHVFKIGRVYSRGQKGYFIDRDGKRKLLWMGSYGIGIGRSMAAIVESHYDKKGIIWPKSVAPFQVHLLVIEDGGTKVRESADEVYKKLIAAEIEVLYDDRNVSAGEKFADADLIGIPTRLVVSEKTKDKIEWKNRAQKKTELLTLPQVIKKLN